VLPRGSDATCETWEDAMTGSLRMLLEAGVEKAPEESRASADGVDLTGRGFASRRIVSLQPWCVMGQTQIT